MKKPERRKVKIILLVCIAFFAFIMPVGLYAQEYKVVKTRDDRRQEAIILYKSYKNYLSKISKLSSEEEAWLKEEYFDELSENGNRYTKRAINAMNSREYGPCCINRPSH